MVSSHRRCLRTIASGSQRDRFVALRRMHAPVPVVEDAPSTGGGAALVADAAPGRRT